MCQTPRKVYFFMTSGHLSGAYYVAQVTRAIVRIYTDLTGILLIYGRGLLIVPNSKNPIYRADTKATLERRPKTRSKTHSKDLPLFWSSSDQNNSPMVFELFSTSQRNFDPTHHSLEYGKARTFGSLKFCILAPHSIISTRYKVHFVQKWTVYQLVVLCICSFAKAAIYIKKLRPIFV